MTTTPGSEMSGYASNSSWVYDQTPAAAITSTPTMTTMRWPSARSSTRASIVLQPFQEDRAVDNDTTVRIQPARDRHVVVRPDSRHDWTPLELAGPTLHEDVRAPVLLHDGRRGNHGERPRRTGMAHGAEHLRNEPPRWVGEIHLDLERARLRIQHRSYPRDPAGELFSGVGDKHDLSLFANVDQPHERLRDVRRDPHRAEVGDRHERSGDVCGRRDGGAIVAGRHADVRHHTGDGRAHGDRLLEIRRRETEQRQLAQRLCARGLGVLERSLGRCEV